MGGGTGAFKGRILKSHNRSRGASSHLTDQKTVAAQISPGTFGTKRATVMV